MNEGGRVADDEGQVRARAKPRTVAPSAGSSAPPPLPTRDYTPNPSSMTSPRPYQNPASPRNDAVSPRGQRAVAPSPRAPPVTRSPTSPRTQQEQPPRMPPRESANQSSAQRSQPANVASPRRAEREPEYLQCVLCVLIQNNDIKLLYINYLSL